MPLDFEFADYRRNVYRKVCEPVEAITTASSGKYRFHYRERDLADVCATPYFGYTVLAEPFLKAQIGSNVAPINNELVKAVAGFVPVPSETLHMTVADLVSGEAFETLKASGHEEGFKDRVREILTKTWAGEGDHVSGVIRGIGCFPSVVIALVDFATEDEYERIVRVRDAIYKDPFLASFGVDRTFPFQGHITLGYLESAPPRGLDTAMSKLRQTYEFGWTFPIEDARLYSFESMSEYQRETS